jgi:putative copper resistance protein D
VALLFDLFGFLDVVFRLIALATEALIVGGIAFLLLVIMPFRTEIGREFEDVFRRSRMLLRLAAVLAAIGAIANVTLNVLLLRASADVPIGVGLTADFAIAEILRAVIATTIFIVAGRATPETARRATLAVLALLLIAAATATSHSMSRMTGRTPLALADALHQAGASIWIGGIPYFVITLGRTHGGLAWRRIGKRFSLMSMGSVAVLVIAGLTLATVFVGSWQGLYGTSYGVMVMGKIALLGGLLMFGFMNFRTVERLRADPSTPILRMRRFAEVEIGVGLSVFALAASITSSPPAIDQIYDQVPWSVSAARMVPVWPPRLSSPDYDQMAIPMLQAKLDAEAAANANAPQHPQAFVPGESSPVPRTPADIAWSEYNHHWAGIFVMVVGILALLARFMKAHWAQITLGILAFIAFLGLDVFLFIRSDPENWPLGKVGFFESFRDAESFQHRIIVLLVLVFVLFEGGVRAKLIKRPWAPLVFPILTAIGGGMLLMHSHNISDVKEQFLIELTHIPLALLAITSAWARWLELRLPAPGNRIPGLVWPITYVLVGLLLLNYREA